MSVYQLQSAWRDRDGVELTLSILEGRPQVVAMTYTSCRVACPRIVATMKRILAETDGRQIGFVLISLDPARDTPEVLSAFADRSGLDRDQWRLLTGSPDNVLELAAVLGVRYQALSDGEFAHSNIISVLDAAGNVVHQQDGLGPDITSGTIDYLRSQGAGLR